MKMAVRWRDLISALSSYILLFFGFYLILTRNDAIGVHLANADQLYFEEIYQGLFLKHIPLHNFLFMAAPDFLHLLLYFAWRILLPMQAAFVAVTLFTLLLFYLLFLQVVRFITEDPMVLRFYRAVLLLGITLLALPGFWIMGSFEVTLLYADHFLNIGIMNLLSLWLVLHIVFYQTRRILLLILLFICVFMTSLSDPTYLSCFTVPILFTLILLMRRMNCLPVILSVGIVIASASAMGFWLLKHLALIRIHVDYSNIVFYTGLQLRIMLTQILEGMTLFMLNNIFLFLLWVYSLYYLLQKTENIKYYFIKSFILTGVCCGLIAIVFFDPDIVPGILLLNLRFLMFRHMAPSIYFPVFLALPLVIANTGLIRVKRVLSQYSLRLVFCCQILILLLVKPVVSLAYSLGSPAQNWPWLICVDQAKARYHLQAGISGYWTMRPLALLAHLPMILLTPNLTPRYWLINTQDFQHKQFDFVVVAASPWELPANPVIQKFGPPAATVLCPSIPNSTTSLALFIYPQGIRYDASTFNAAPR